VLCGLFAVEQLAGECILRSGSVLALHNRGPTLTHDETLMSAPWSCT
jgi:hypothetical protein